MDKDIFVSKEDKIDLLPFDEEEEDALGEAEEELDSIARDASNIHHRDPLPQFDDHTDESWSQTHVDWKYGELKE